MCIRLLLNLDKADSHDHARITALEAEIDGIEGKIARCAASVPAVQVLLTITICISTAEPA